MRILLIDVNCKYSSTGKIVYELYQKAVNAGHEACICYGRGDLVQEPNIYKFGIDIETNIHAALARITGYNGCFSPLSTAGLLQRINEFKPDLIHIHELHAYFVNQSQLLEYIKKAGIPVLWTFHCEYMYTGKCGQANQCSRFQTGCGNCPAVREYPKSLWFDKTAQMFSAKQKMMNGLNLTIATPSAWLSERVGSSFLRNVPRTVIHNGIDTGIFHPADPGVIDQIRFDYNLQGKQIVLSVAPDIMSSAKGGPEVLKLAKKTDSISNLYFVLVGGDSTRRLSDNSMLIARTKDQSELAGWYSLADVFLICSKTETFPTTCLEAFCCGTQVIGYDLGGTKETIPAPFGHFCAPDTEALYPVLMKALKHVPDRLTVSEHGASLYSRDVMCQSYMTLYLDICQHAGKELLP